MTLSQLLQKLIEKEYFVEAQNCKEVMKVLILGLLSLASKPIVIRKNLPHPLKP